MQTFPVFFSLLYIKTFSFLFVIVKPFLVFIHLYIINPFDLPVPSGNSAYLSHHCSLGVNIYPTLYGCILGGRSRRLEKGLGLAWKPVKILPTKLILTYATMSEGSHRARGKWPAGQGDARRRPVTVATLCPQCLNYMPYPRTWAGRLIIYICEHIPMTGTPSQWIMPTPRPPFKVLPISRRLIMIFLIGQRL